MNLFINNVGLKALFRTRIIMLTWFTNLRNLKERMIFLFGLLYKPIAYNLNVMRQSACVVFNTIRVDNCTPVYWASDYNNLNQSYLC